MATAVACIQNAGSSVLLRFGRKRRELAGLFLAAAVHPNPRMPRITSRTSFIHRFQQRENRNALLTQIRMARVGGGRFAVGRAGIEPPRGAVHHRASEGGRHRLLHVQELRVRPRRLRDVDRELPAAAGRVRRSELFHARPERRLRHPHRQQWRREGGRDVPLSLPQPDPGHLAQHRRRQQHADGSRAGDHDGARCNRSGSVRSRRSQRVRDLHGRADPRGQPQFRSRVDERRGRRDAHGIRQAGRQRGFEVDSELRRVCC